MSDLNVISKHQAQWGEGPIWWQGILYWVDIEGHKVIAYDPETDEEVIHDVGERVGTVVPRISGGLVIAGDNGFSFLDTESGKVTPIADPEPDKKPDNRFNDGKCDPGGRFWAGTISTVKKTGDAALYMLDADLTVHKKFSPVTNSNGICWSADHQTMFYIDTPTKEIRAFDFDNDTGTIVGGRTVVDTSDLEGSPDGMAIDERGYLWVALCRGGTVVCFDPVSGSIQDRIWAPVPGVTACTFGGSDLKTLYITTGQFKDDPDLAAGYVYATRLTVAGMPSFGFSA